MKKSRPLSHGSAQPSILAALDSETKRTVGRTSKGITITMPERVDFEENYEATTKVLRLLRKASISGIRISKLRFDEMRYISPAAALVLTSEIDRWNQRVNERLRAETETWDETIKTLLAEMGFFELLHKKQPKFEPVGKDVTFLKFQRGIAGAHDPGREAQNLRKKIEAIVTQRIKKLALFDALSEAIVNVGHHAYGLDTLSFRRQWWLSASYDKKRRSLVVIFYDQGDGIPKTLPTKWHSFELIRKLFNKMTDSEKIEAAMEYGRSATGRSERGKGLRQMIEFARAYPGGNLSIYSLRGLYRVTPTSAELWDGTRRDHETSIGGTLIEWSVKL